MRNGQNDHKAVKSSFFHKINKNRQRKPGVKCFVHSRVWRHSHWIQDFMMMMMMVTCFVVWLTDERRLALFPAGTTARDPHHRKSLTCRK